MWVHRVTRFLPGRTSKEFVTFAAKLGVKGKLEPHGATNFVIHAKNGHDAYFYPDDGELAYHSPTSRHPSRITEAEARKWNEKIDIDKAETLAQAWLKARGILPVNAVRQHRATVCQATDKGPPIRLRYLFQYEGALEGRPCHGTGCRMKFDVYSDARMGSLRYAWFESERLGSVECKTQEEAAEALNKGHAGPVDKTSWGGKWWVSRVVYYIDPDAEVVHPCYLIMVQKGGSLIPYYVPAAKGKYFKNPKKQVMHQ